MRTIIFIAAIILLLLSGIISFYYHSERNITSQWVNHTNIVLQEAEKTFSSAKDFESESRGYPITGDSNFLEQYFITKDMTFDHLKKLKELTKDNRQQQERIDSLSILIEKRMAFSQQSIQLRNEKGFEDSQKLIATRKEKFEMDKIRNLFSEIETCENNLLILRQNRNNQSIAAFSTAFIIFLTAAFILLLIHFFALRYYLNRCKKAESVWRDDENQIQPVFKSAPDAVIVINDKGDITKWNPKAEILFGWTEQEALGESLINKIIPERSREAHKNAFLSLSKTGEVSILGKMIEITAVDKNEIELYVALSISPTLIKDKYFFIAFIRDITQQKKAEERRINLFNGLEKVNEDLETFSYSVSHNLKSPLRSITSFLQLFLKKYREKLDEDAMNLIYTINKKACKGNQLVDDLLNFSRLGKKDLDPYFVDMNELVMSLVEEELLINSHSLKIICNTLENCHGDKALLEQVWINLISNAVKYSKTREIQYIQIGSSKKNDKIIYWIKDNGVGFDMQYSSKLFEVFQRLHCKDEFEGSGIGLALVKRIIEKHGGEVWAEGEIDKGAIFYFSIYSRL